MKSGLLLAGIGGVLGLLGWLALRAGPEPSRSIGAVMQRDSPPTPQEASIENGAPVEVVRGPAPSAAIAPTTGPTQTGPLGSDFPPGSVGSLLVQFYGDEWETVRGELAQRIDLYMQPDIPIPPWESVLADLRERMRVQDSTFERWKLRYAPPEPITLEHLAEKYSVGQLELDGRDVTALEAVLVDPRAEVQHLLERLRSSCDVLLARKFELGQYNYGLFSNIRSDRLPKRAFYADGTGIRGWSVTWGIAADEDPEIAALLAELDAARKRIRLQVHEYLVALK